VRTTSSYLTHLSKIGDRMLLGVIAGLLALSFALASWHQTLDAALVIGVPAALFPAWLVWSRSGELVTRCAIAAALMIFSALHIHQAHGMIEVHFMIFVLLSFLLIYRDWIPLVFAAGVIAVHHLAFDFLQRAGQPIWVFADAGGFGIVLVHAAFVIFETALLVWMAIALRGEIEAVGCEPRELSRVSRELATGNLTVEVNTAGASATSLVRAMELMRSELATSFQRERSSSEENGRIRAALDRVSSGAMLADSEGKIIYMNDAMHTLLRHQSNEIRQQIPQFDPERLLGTSFESFHPLALRHNPLSNDASPLRAEVKFGGASLRLVATSILDTDRRRIGTVIEWFDRTSELTAEEEVKAIVASAVGGDLTSRVRQEGKEGFLKTLGVGMNQLLDNMTEVVRTMTTIASEVSIGAEEILNANRELRSRTEEQSARLEETASSMEEMTSAVKGSADNAARANLLATEAREQAERGGAVVGATATAMGQIDASSKRIADIIGVINEIALQTNLLALNAAVEAARAGEQGRGFAVVAAEVRNLASRSAAAAKEIKTLIHDSVSKVGEGTQLVDDSGQALREIVNGVKKVTVVMAEIANSSREQASGIQQVNQAITMLDRVTQQNSTLVGQAAAAAQALTAQADGMKELMSRYHVKNLAVTGVAGRWEAEVPSLSKMGAAR